MRDKVVDVPVPNADSTAKRLPAPETPPKPLETLTKTTAPRQNICLPPPCRYITLLLRHNSPRKWQSVPDALQVLRSSVPKHLHQKYRLRTLTLLPTMSLRQQIEAIRTTSVLIAVHGAGLAWEVLLPPRARVVQVSCEERGGGNGHYKTLVELSEPAYSRETADAELRSENVGWDGWPGVPGELRRDALRGGWRRGFYFPVNSGPNCNINDEFKAALIQTAVQAFEAEDGR